MQVCKYGFVTIWNVSLVALLHITFALRWLLYVCTITFNIYPYMYVTYYLWLSNCYLLAESFYLKLAITFKNLFLSLVVVRLVIFYLWLLSRDMTIFWSNDTQIKFVIWKKNRILFSSTLRLWENKTTLFLFFLASRPSFGHIFVLKTISINLWKEKGGKRRSWGFILGLLKLAHICTNILKMSSIGQKIKQAEAEVVPSSSSVEFKFLKFKVK